jgi:imidazolonepropionase-like amidohydrolase
MARDRDRGSFLFTGSGLAAIVAGLVAAAAQQPQTPYAPGRPIAIVGGQLIDATGAAPRTGQTILIQNERITDIGPSGSITVPDGAQVIDAEGLTVMPGLINSNQHIQMGGLFPAPTANMPLDKVTERWGRLFAGSERRAWVYLMQGHTSMRQTSGPTSLMTKVKKAIDSGQTPGPRIFLGGGLFRSEAEWPFYVRSAPPETHGFLRNDLAFIVIKDIDKDTKPYEGPEFAYWKLRMGDVAFDGKNDFTDDEIRAFIAKAHRLGKKVDCHCANNNEDFRRMMQFDIDTL